jgi:hypothetical protein
VPVYGGQMAKTKGINISPTDGGPIDPETNAVVEEFVETFQPLEQGALFLLRDARTGASYCECHIRASRLIPLATVDVPLDPDDQADYRANREVVENHLAFERMKTDATQGRSFSNLVAEYTTSYDAERPLKIIGGQHRYRAIEGAVVEGVDEYHGLKVYFGLDTDQRLDVQLISNTNIAVSPDLLDRMYETVKGPELRDWCQEVDLLLEGQDFADRKKRGLPITVRAARTFILNYYRGREVNSKDFDRVQTTPIVAKTGGPDPEWDEFRTRHSEFVENEELKRAGREYAALVQAQRSYFEKKNSAEGRGIDLAEKGLNIAILSAWAYVAGVLETNETRLKRHFALRDIKGKDPLNSDVLAKGRHKTDPENYRGLGYRTDAKERGRFVELLFLQAEKGEGINKKLVDLAIMKYHAKQAMLDVLEAESK